MSYINDKISECAILDSITTRRDMSMLLLDKYKKYLASIAFIALLTMSPISMALKDLGAEMKKEALDAKAKLEAESVLKEQQAEQEWFKQQKFQLEKRLSALPDKAIQAVFIHPGFQDDSLWSITGDIMNAAAKDLNIDLLIMYSKRNYRLKEYLATRYIMDDKPDYLIVTNEGGKIPKIAEAAYNNGIKLIVLIDPLSRSERLTMPQNHLTNIVFTMTAPDRESGYLMATKMFEKSKKIQDVKDNFSFRLLAINTTDKSPSAYDRELGLLDALEEYPLVLMEEVHYAHHDMKKVKKIVLDELKEHGGIHYIWAGSDSIALTIIETISAYDKENESQTDYLIASSGWSDMIFEKINSKEMTVSVGGNYFLGAWAMVGLYDYHMRTLPMEYVGKNWIIPISGVMNVSNLPIFEKNLPKRNWNLIDFTRFPLGLSSGAEQHDFTLDAIYNNLKTERKVRKMLRAQAIERAKKEADKKKKRKNPLI